MWDSNGVVPAGGHRVDPVSDVAVLDERAIAAAVPAPHIETVNVSKSSKVHVGTKVVCITQNVHNKEMLKGLNETWYLRRDEWQAMPSYGEDFLKLPIGFVIIGHSAANNCEQRYRCIEAMLEVQRDHMRRGFSDIGPNFLVGGNGDVFEGRGANVFGAMVTSWNRRSISIMFLGNYVLFKPIEVQFNHTSILLDTLVREGVLKPDYILYGQCQLLPLTVSPGPLLVSELKRFPHWNNTGKNECLPG
ncbi:jg26736 [Pararge aegeria aegeria]|uniref:Jg26736 protein n=2 Tax=Pararge aegeria TaxID=116150 RepID=A0A8S4REG1_9NEOP|nr:jg26736 [Pararge aegeria aegeria]